LWSLSEAVLAREGDVKPFHEAILPAGIIAVTEFERSFSTRLGSTFEEAARLIALQRNALAERQHTVSGQVTRRADKEIEDLVKHVDEQGWNGSYIDTANRIAAIDGNGGVGHRVLLDLYVKRKDGSESYFEMKSPKPNKGQCLEVISRLLHVHASKRMASPGVQTYFAMAYNPYGEDRASYEHSFALRYLDFKNMVLLGSEFWNLIGGEGTYDEVLGIYREVGREKGPNLIEQLALGY
ncbi:MAG: TdeIII family type II restriction endonuclease, partial [candidate division WOR-3 bacterium]